MLVRVLVWPLPGLAGGSSAGSSRPAGVQALTGDGGVNGYSRPREVSGPEERVALGKFNSCTKPICR